MEHTGRPVPQPMSRIEDEGGRRDNSQDSERCCSVQVEKASSYFGPIESKRASALRRVVVVAAIILCIG